MTEEAWTLIQHATELCNPTITWNSTATQGEKDAFYSDMHDEAVDVAEQYRMGKYEYI